MIKITLKAINEDNGFCIDDEFCENVLSHIKEDKKNIIDNELCAIVIACFLAKYEDERISITIN